MSSIVMNCIVTHQIVTQCTFCAKIKHIFHYFSFIELIDNKFIYIHVKIHISDKINLFSDVFELIDTV